MEIKDLSDITIVVLSFNRLEALSKSLPLLIELASEWGSELIIVDNASTDGSRQMIESLSFGRPGVFWVGNDSNLGVARGRNVGWRRATREFILNLDDDISISVDAVRGMRAVLLKMPDVGIVCPRIINSNTGVVQYDYGGDCKDITNYTGACHMVRREVVAAVGFNDDACVFGGEELSLSIRVRAAGYRVVFTDKVEVFHDHKIREGAESRERRARWVYNYTRIYYQFFPFGFASLLTVRTLTSHLISGVKSHGFRIVADLIHSAWSGSKVARREHTPIPLSHISFYKNPDLRPEFGNVPLWRKVKNKMLSK